MIGIYEILNKITGKRYIGQSVDIKRRFRDHRCALTRKSRSKDTNRYLYNAVLKYGIDSFDFNIIEIVDSVNDLDFYELKWIKYFKTTDRQYGYNLRTDIGGRGYTHKETKELISKNNTGKLNPNFGNKWSEEKKLKMSAIKKEQYVSGKVEVNYEASRKGVEARNKKWNDNPELKVKMAEKVSDKLRKYDIARLDMNTEEILEVYEGRLDLKRKHPDYYTQAILGCCSGTKKSYRGYKWKYIDR